jgi:hypothetical protein
MLSDGDEQTVGLDTTPRHDLPFIVKAELAFGGNAHEIRNVINHEAKIGNPISSHTPFLDGLLQLVHDGLVMLLNFALMLEVGLIGDLQHV